MGNVLKRDASVFKRSVNTPDYPAQDWIHNPNVPDGVPLKHLKIDGDAVTEMTASEKQDADDAIDAARDLANQAAANKLQVDPSTALKAIIKLGVTNGHWTLHEATAAIVAEMGGA